MSRVALITGAGGDIGRATAKAFAQKGILMNLRQLQLPMTEDDGSLGHQEDTTPGPQRSPRGAPRQDETRCVRWRR